MIEDVVKELGYLALGTRLKRLGERLQSQTQVLLGAAGIDLPSSLFPVLAALDRLGPLRVGELTEALGVSQPGVTRMLEKLSEEGLVQSRQHSADRRVRTIALSRSGQHLIARARRVVWPRVTAAVADACSGPARPLLAQLAALEEAIAAAPLNVRAERARPGTRRHAAA
ncbi:MAG TPA: MarR family transcriptional regulator [Steroidobacteraceae bacterium]|nr:MarR family transcriptional regulator [Steroidobacteraceae bacterium]